MDKEKKITRDKTRPNRKIKMNNEMKKRLIITVSTLLVLLIAIIIVVSRVTNQTSADVGKQNTNNSQTDKNDKKPEEEENPGDTQQPNDTPTEEKPTEQQPQNPNQGTETKDPQEGKTGKEKYYIKVNNQANVVTIYKKDSNGYYTVPCKAMVCSIGTSTPESGVYKTSDKYTWRKLFGHTEGTYVYGQYATRIINSILFHSVPYQNPNDPSSLEYWEYDKLGTKASAGRTVAAPSNLPFGTKLNINGKTYVVEDRGGAIKGNRIDVYVGSHSEALAWGVRYLPVEVIN